MQITLEGDRYFTRKWDGVTYHCLSTRQSSLIHAVSIDEVSVGQCFMLQQPDRTLKPYTVASVEPIERENSASLVFTLREGADIWNTH